MAGRRVLGPEFQPGLLEILNFATEASIEETLGNGLSKDNQTAVLIVKTDERPADKMAAGVEKLTLRFAALCLHQRYMQQK